MRQLLILSLLCVTCRSFIFPQIITDSLSVQRDTTSIPIDSTVVLRFGGDLLLAGYYEAFARDSGALAFQDFDLFHSDDITIVNNECPITSRGFKVPKPYNFRMRPSYAKVFPEAGIELVNLANNHIFDYGEEGLFDTISYLDSLGVHHIGAGRNSSEARKPVIMKLKGRTVAFLGYYGGGEAPAASRHSSGVASRDLGIIRHDIREVKERDSVDFIAVTLHWGTEKAKTPDSTQIDFARQVVDAGADVVVGHHPHVLQGIERYRNGVIVYSLGNFLFGGNSRNTYDTALFEIRIARNGTKYALIPVGVRDWKLTVLGGPERERVLREVSDLSMNFPRSIFIEKENP
jgi:poly-gamma-glutamate synthesis protein (capsule biosynthesis protein)